MPVAEGIDANMPHLPIQQQPLPTDVTLPRDVALQVADLARVPAQEQEPFCDAVCDSVRMAWERVGGAVSKPGPALIKAAKAARTLNEAFGSLNKTDRAWIDKLLAKGHPYAELPREFLPLTVWQITHLFN